MVCKNDKQNIVEVKTLKVNGGNPECVTDFLSVEEPLEIYIAGEFDGIEFSRSVAVTMRTPGNDEELALGFLFSEGIISEFADIGNVWTKGCNFIGITLETGVRVEMESMEKLDRHSFVNSSCGVCGKKSIAAVMQRRESLIESEVTVSRDVISAMPNTLRHQQPDFTHTGGIHASALFDLEGNHIAVREDVGRHNALDKLIGTQLTAQKLPLNECVLLLSGRASFELIQKAAGAGIPIVAAVGAPSSLAVELANNCGITLLGFVRDNRFNIYTGDQRIRV
jgi:FdhD protein